MDNELIIKALEYVDNKQFQQLKALFSEMQAADIQELFEELTESQVIVVFRLLPKELAAEVFVEMDSDHQEILINNFSDKELKSVLDELFADDTADIIEEMPANVVKRILANSKAEMRKTVNELLKYPKDSAGSIMTTEYVALRRNMTVSQAFELIRKVAIDKETIYTCYVRDTDRKLIGLVTAKTLMISPLDAVIEDIMESNIISASTLDDKEDVAKMFEKYDFLALPVVDNENRIVGIVTVDDAIDVIHEELEEDFAKMNAIMPNEKEYLRTGVFELFVKRIPWLMFLMVSATFTGMIIDSFESALSGCAILVAFIPMLMGTGGNSGSQSSVTVIRGLSLGEVEFKDLIKVVWKEIRVAFLCGLALALINFVKIMIVDKAMMGDEITVTVALVICITLFVTVLAAKLIGCVLPMLADKIGFDPAVMASPFITTLIDAVSLIVYFEIAQMVLGIG